jgi:hypothetical protein
MQARTEEMGKARISPKPHSRRRGRRRRDGLNAPQWEAKYGRRSRSRPPYNFARHRINEIEKLIRHRHDGVAPDTDDADRYVWVVAQHMGHISRETVETELLRWCERWAPDFPADQITEIASRAAKNPHKFTADKLAQSLGLKEAEREALKITTIGAVDCSAEQRAAKRAEKKRVRECQRARRQRRAQGKPSRAEYEATSLSETKPWERRGISRSTWYRRQAQQLADEQKQREHAEIMAYRKPRQNPFAAPPPEDPSHPKTEEEWEALSTKRRPSLGEALQRGIKALKNAA